jgi:phosphate transport system protein
MTDGLFSAAEARDPQTMREALDEELRQIESKLHEEGALVVRALRGSMNAVMDRDDELADEVIAFDDEVDDYYRALEQRIQDLLARNTPVAGDLRLVLAMLHINLHLERMADYAVTIAKLAKLVSGIEPDESVLAAVAEMGDRAEEMIRVSLDSFEKRDLVGAESLVDLDELIDRSNRRFVDRLLEIGSQLDQREWGLRMVLISRTLERIGDHAVDVGEQTAYLLTGEFREFTDASHRGES